MVITYHGLNYFRVQSGECVVLVDPTNARSFKGANIVLSTVKPPLVEGKEEGVFWIENQGEYEREGVQVRGWSAGRGTCPCEEEKKECEKTVYLFTVENIKTVVLGHVTGDLSPEIVENLQGADIVIVPVGEHLSAEKAAKTVRQIEPGMVIPSFVGAAPKKFFDEMGSHPEAEEKITVKKKDIGEGAMAVRYIKA